MADINKNVLYMDDDPDILELVSLKLEQLGYHVDTAPDGVKGLEMLRAGHYDLALVDFEMPGPDGISVIRDIVANGPDIPAVMISAVGDQRIVAQALRAGAADYIAKEADDSYLEYLPISLERSLEKQRIIEENRETHAALQESEQRYRVLVENNPLCIQEIDLEGRLLSINQAGLDMLGVKDKQEILGSQVQANADDHVKATLHQALQDARNGLPSHNLEIEISEPDSTGSRYFSTSMTPIRDKAGKVEKVMAISTDLTERKLFELRLIHMAQHDMLTDLPNRNLIYDHLGMVMSRAHRQSHQAAFLHIDLDDFKKINDEYGNTTGDIVLMEVAKRLRNGIRDSDMTARLAGDEFGIVLSDLEDKEGAERVANDLINRLSRPYQLGSLRVQVSCSIGIALFPDHGDTQEIILSKADRAMETSKRAGKKQFRFARKSN